AWIACIDGLGDRLVNIAGEYVCVTTAHRFPRFDRNKKRTFSSGHYNIVGLTFYLQLGIRNLKLETSLSEYSFQGTPHNKFEQVSLFRSPAAFQPVNHYLKNSVPRPRKAVRVDPTNIFSNS